MLLHGLGSSLEKWHETGHVEALKDDYRLVLIDARGHGGSDKPHDPEAYEMELMVADVVAVLNDINVDKAHFLGYSMGGVIGFGIAKHAPDHFYSLIIGGAQPHEQDSWKKSWLQLFKKGAEATLVEVEKVFGPRMTPWLKNRCLTNDMKALIALTSIRWLGLEDCLPTMAMPCPLFIGEADGYYSGARQCAKSIPNVTFVSFSSLNHFECLYRIDLVLPHIIKFLTKVSQT